ncbi:hypothetical protein BOX15_Mlig033276g3 [Macrostomum lignano]|uniref:Uncharacterized protein n=1 Tax=Macrostomum lignano TaxID=282301 RepID=A0A267E0B0_9PLAT|nr:hypothetical protein BOX15_Mlig033276g3 [Macrostomum lignano]
MRFAFAQELLSDGFDGPADECRRSGHALALAGGRVFAVGGGQFAAISPPMLQFDLAAGRWTLLNAAGDAPDADVAGCVLFADGRASLLAFGGRLGGGRLSDKLFRLDLRQRRWMLAAQVGPDRPAPRSGALACGVGHRLYLMSGDAGGEHGGGIGCSRRSADLWQLDAAQCRWTRLPDPPIEVAESADCLSGVGADCLFAVGGGCCWQFDLFTRRWSRVPVSRPAGWGDDCFIIFDDEETGSHRSRRLLAATAGGGRQLFVLGCDGAVDSLDTCLATAWQPVPPADSAAVAGLPRYLAAACTYTADAADASDSAGSFGLLVQGGLAWPSGRPLADLQLLRFREQIV